MVFWQPDRCFPSGKILETFGLRECEDRQPLRKDKVESRGFDLEMPQNMLRETFLSYAEVRQAVSSSDLTGRSTLS